MDIILQAAAQVTDFPGSLIYHLVLVFALGAAAAIAVGRWRRPLPGALDGSGGRLALAATGLVGLRLVSLALALAAAFGLLDPLVPVPPFERAASTLTILLSLWLIALPRSMRLLDAMMGLAVLLVVVGLGLSWALWAQEARVTAFYNGTAQETAWEAVQIGLLVGGLAAMPVMAVRRRPHWLPGLAIFGLLLAGHIIHYRFPLAGANVAGVVRLVEIVAMPMLAALIYLRADGTPSPAPAVGAVSAQPEPVVEAAEAALPTPAASPQPAVLPVDPAAVLALADLPSAADQAALAQSITAVVAHALRAPVGLLLAPRAPDASGADVWVIASAYDLARRRHVIKGPLTVTEGDASGEKTLISVAQLALRDNAHVVAALRRGETVAWTPEADEVALRSLAQTASLGQLGPVLLAPIRAASGSLLAVFGVLPPAGQAAWPPAHRDLLTALAGSLARAWQSVGQSTVAPPSAAPDALAAALAERDTARQEVVALQRAADLHADQLQELEDLRLSMQALQPEMAQQRERAAQLASELEQARAALLLAQAPTQAAQAEVDAPEQLAALRSNMAALHAELEQYRASEAALQAELEQTRASEATLRAQADEAQAQTEAGRVTAEQDRPDEMPTLAAATPAREAAAPLETLQAELADYRQQVTRLRTELDFALAELSQRPAADAGSAASALTLSFDDPEHGLAEMLEALANAEDRLMRQAAELAELREDLAESERLRLAPPTAAPARPVQAADMEVIASLTQELRQPMSSIIGYSDLLLSESVGLIGALQRKFLERIKASSERIGVLLDDLMRIMDIDSGNLKLATENVDVGRVIDDALRATETQFREKNLSLVCDVPPNLPPLQADRDALLQIFSHLLGNSGAASASDSEVRLTVQHETEQRPGHDARHFLIISVTDTGGGISPNDQPRVFSRLYRADAPLIAGLGDNGMGLSVAKALVEGHGGRVWVISNQGVGSTFYVLLPVEGRTAKTNGARPER